MVEVLGVLSKFASILELPNFTGATVRRADEAALLKLLRDAVEASAIHTPLLARLLQPAPSLSPSHLCAPVTDAWDPRRWPALLAALHVPPAAIGDGVAQFVADRLASAAAATAALPTAAALAKAVQRLVTVASTVAGTAADVCEQLRGDCSSELVATAAVAVRVATHSRSSVTDSLRAAAMAEAASPAGTPPLGGHERRLFPDGSPPSHSPAVASHSPAVLQPLPQVTGGQSTPRAPWLPVQLTAWGTVVSCTQVAAALLTTVHAPSRSIRSSGVDAAGASLPGAVPNRGLQRELSLAGELGSASATFRTPPPAGRQGSGSGGDKALYALPMLQLAQHVFAEAGALRDRVAAATTLLDSCSASPTTEGAVAALDDLVHACLLALLAVRPPPLIPFGWPCAVCGFAVLCSNSGFAVQVTPDVAATLQAATMPDTGMAPRLLAVLTHVSRFAVSSSAPAALTPLALTALAALTSAALPAEGGQGATVPRVAAADLAAAVPMAPLVQTIRGALEPPPVSEVALHDALAADPSTRLATAVLVQLCTCGAVPPAADRLPLVQSLTSLCGTLSAIITSAAPQASSTPPVEPPLVSAPPAGVEWNTSTAGELPGLADLGEVQPAAPPHGHLANGARSHVSTLRRALRGVLAAMLDGGDVPQAVATRVLHSERRGLYEPLQLLATVGDTTGAPLCRPALRTAAGPSQAHLETVHILASLWSDKLLRHTVEQCPCTAPDRFWVSWVLCQDVPVRWCRGAHGSAPRRKQHGAARARLAVALPRRVATRRCIVPRRAAALALPSRHRPRTAAVRPRSRGAPLVRPAERRGAPA